MTQTELQPDNGRPDDEPSAVDDPRVAAALEVYLAELEAGRRPDRRDFLAAHPDVASALAGCLDSLDVLHAAAPQLQPAAPATPPIPDAASLPLGDYRLLREVGRGGMGVVYEATQLSLGRRVALKVLPFAAALDQRQRQRFQNEAQAAALLHHTNIVPVFGVGCERGVYYYAMQFIDGRTVGDLIHEMRRLEGLDAEFTPVSSGAATKSARDSKVEPPTVSTPAPPPAPETIRNAAAGASTERSARGPAFYHMVARLGVQAAEALEHAHQQGIVHRDIKPANLLLEERDHVWVTDFGLARCQNEAGLTVTGDLVGTLRYMSPEQALARRGVIDHRTDIYSLGATLYELLTLEPVFPGTDRQELLRQIAFDEPRTPRAIRRSVPRELDTIVLKALAKAPEERYATAQELADDLRRFLEDRPILARPPALREKAAKWLRRHRAVAVSAFAVLLLAVVGLTVSTVLIAQEQARTKLEQARTKAAYDAEVVQRDRADRSFRQAWDAVNYFAEVAAADMADRPEMQAIRRKNLEAAYRFYQSFIDDHRDDPTIQAELARSHMRVASILTEIGSPAEAVASAREAERIIQQQRASGHPAALELERDLSSVLLNLSFIKAGTQAFLLSQKSVQDELKLSDAQRQALSQVNDLRRDTFRRKNPEEWNAKFKELIAQEKVVVEGLAPDQARRLGQIALQQRGARALVENEIADALRLGDEQKQKIRALIDSRTRFGPPGPNPGLNEQLLAVLTPEQKAKWQELTGEPFKGDIRRGFHGGHGGPPWPDSRKHP